MSLEGLQPWVTVVVPTIGRSTLYRALRSVREQTYGRVRAVVVVDAADEALVDPAALSLADEVLCTGGGRGAPAGRNLGVAATDDPLVAFLDDDDTWLPLKVESQLARIGTLGDATVAASRVHLRARSGEVRRTPVPHRSIRRDESPEDYLFRRRRPGPGRASLFTSTLLTTRRVAESTPWDESLRRHQDWDWLVRAARTAKASLVQVEEPLAVIDVGSPSSISASAHWASSLSWARQWEGSWEKATYVDFLAGQPLRYALQARSATGVRDVLRAIAEAGRAPSVAACAVALSGVASRGAIEYLLTRGPKHPEIGATGRSGEEESR